MRGRGVVAARSHHSGREPVVQRGGGGGALGVGRRLEALHGGGYVLAGPLDLLGGIENSC